MAAGSQLRLAHWKWYWNNTWCVVQRSWWRDTVFIFAGGADFERSKETNKAEGLQLLNLSRCRPRQARTPRPTPTPLVKLSVQPSAQGYQST